MATSSVYVLYNACTTHTRNRCIVSNDVTFSVEGHAEQNRPEVVGQLRFQR